MEPYCCRDSLSSLDKETFVYDLSAVVMHHGKGFGSGHYTAYCYNTEGGACALFWGKQNCKQLVVCALAFVLRGVGNQISWRSVVLFPGGFAGSRSELVWL